MKPKEVENITFVDPKTISWPEVPVQHHPHSRRPAPPADEDDGGVSEGEPWEETEITAWPGKAGSWWRVNGSLTEDVVIRMGVSLASSELQRIRAGDLVQQAGRARVLVSGRANGCIRLPIRPTGWVTADAQAAGGPKYLVKAGVPRWRVVFHSSPVIVRSDFDLTSKEVETLYNGDIVEQAGPTSRREDGLIRMPITPTIVRRSEGDGDHDGHVGQGRVLGWVTLDATEAGGPLFFKPAPDADASKRRRRPKGG